jgi:hypothetical protein
VERVRELRESYRIEEFIFDPRRAKQAALELEREGVRCVELPQTDVRMVPASARLCSAVVERRVVLPPTRSWRGTRRMPSNGTGGAAGGSTSPTAPRRLTPW